MSNNNTKSDLRNFLEVSYEELEKRNLTAKQKQLEGVPSKQLEKEYIQVLGEHHEIKAVTVCFTDLEGKFHMLDYDKKFLLKSYDNLTFDGSSVRGFSVVSESDLRLALDWGSFRWLPSDIFGAGKVLVFGLIQEKNGQPYPADMRHQLALYLKKLNQEQDIRCNISVECEGFLFKEVKAEQSFSSREGFDLVSLGGYYQSLPKDPLRQFIDCFAEVQRAMGFENEKDHFEVAPSQFELNYSYTDALLAADQLQLYKIIARQVANNMGFTASFLPKPIAGINGSGMHTNISLAKGGKNIFYAAEGEDNLSKEAWDFIDRILNNANDICLILNSSVNSYRRLDPNFEAPNQIKSSAVDRTSMIRIPLGNEKSARVEVRTVAPDCNPYLAFYSLIRTGLEGAMQEEITAENRRTRTKFLPGNIYDAMRLFKASTFMSELLGEDVKAKYVERKNESAERCPKALGTMVKTEEILFHHEVTNQYLWGKF